jgi:nucleoid DNA-binding protein
MMANNKASKPASAKAMTKAAVTQEVAEATGLSKKQVGEVFAALTGVMTKQLGKKGPGVFNLFGLIKMKTQRKPPTKETQKPNPFKPGEMMTVKAKPASVRIRARALKTLNDAVS